MLLKHKVVSHVCAIALTVSDDDELANLYSAIKLEGREYYTSRALTTAEKKFETSVS